MHRGTRPAAEPPGSDGKRQDARFAWLAAELHIYPNFGMVVEESLVNQLACGNGLENNQLNDL